MWTKHSNCQTQSLQANAGWGMHPKMMKQLHRPITIQLALLGHSGKAVKLKPVEPILVKEWVWTTTETTVPPFWMIFWSKDRVNLFLKMHYRNMLFTL